jgi:HSP20 family protein
MRTTPFEDLEAVLARMSQQVEEGVTGLSRSVPVDLRETEDAFVAVVDLPGYDADDIDLTVTDRQLRVDAERDTGVEGEADGQGASETDDPDRGHESVRHVRRERTRDSVSRSIRLPEPVDEEAVEATLEEGVLTVTLPKQYDTEGRSIEIDD